MAVDAVPSPAPARPLGTPSLTGRLAAVPAAAALGGIVAVSVVVRALASLRHPTPLLLPDEYTYAELARSIAETGRPLVRGAPASFPALLEPLLTAPFWLAGETETAYRLTQGFHALAMSLAAIPVYLLARRIGLAAGVSLAAAGLAVAAPGLVYTSFVLADPVGYPLALTALYLAVRALERPSARAQCAFLAVAGLATFARLQYAVLVPVFLAAALVVERGRPLAFVRAVRPTLAVCAGGVAAAFALGPARVLGVYSGLAELEFGVGTAVSWLPSNAMLLAYATGWVLVPGALVGIAYALFRPSTRAERAFAALAVGFAAALVAEAAVIAAHDAARFQERYLITLAPLAPIAFGLSIARGRTAARAGTGAALALLVVSARVPLSGYTETMALSDAPTLWAVQRLEDAWDVGTAALAVAAAAALLALVAVAAALRPRIGVPLALACAFASSGALAVGAHSFDARNAAPRRDAVFPRGVGWVDEAGLGTATLVQTPRSSQPPALMQLFWNRSLASAARLRGGLPVDGFATPLASVAADGTMLLEGEPLRSPLLFATEGSSVRLRGAALVASTPGFALWRPAPAPRLALLAVGHYDDGWLADAGSVTVWPANGRRTRGTLRFVLMGPPELEEPARIRFRGRAISRDVTVAAGRRVPVEIALDARGPVEVTYTAASGRFDGRRSVSVRSTAPIFQPD